VIAPWFLREAFAPDRNISVSELARILKVHRNTIHRMITVYGITRGFSSIPDSELDGILRDWAQDRPDSGYQYAHAYIRTLGLRIQKMRVRLSLSRVNGITRAITAANTIEHRQYRSKRPNAVWHMDGHHKLIPYGIVLHGIIDGYCHTVSLLTSDTIRLVFK
jgi:hypothetical protein